MGEHLHLWEVSELSEIEEGREEQRGATHREGEFSEALWPSFGGWYSASQKLGAIAVNGAVMAPRWSPADARSALHPKQLALLAREHCSRSHWLPKYGLSGGWGRAGRLL